MAGRTFQMVDLIEMYVHWDAGQGSGKVGG
jgi:hypothetical protein